MVSELQCSTMASHFSSPTRLTSSSHHPILLMVIPSTRAPLNIRLNYTNYTFWRFQILSAVRAHDLEGFLFGTKIKPKEFIIDLLDSNTTLNNPDYFSWIRLDQFLMSRLLSSIIEQMLGHVVNCRSSAEVSSLLEQLFFFYQI